MNLSLTIFFLPLIASVLAYYFFIFIFPRKSKYLESKRWGGILLGVIFLICLSAYYFLFPNFLLKKDFLSLFFGVGILFVGGIWDDLENINWKKQLIFQGIAAVIMLLAGDTIDHIKLPWGEVLWFPIVIRYIIAFVWIVLVINSLNWFDGVDGLSGSIGIITLIILAFISFFPPINQPATTLLCLMVVGIILGFLFFNLPPAYVYLGTSGVWILGFLIAVISIFSGGKVATTALVMGLPIINFLLVSFQRFMKGKMPVLGGDRLHFHERLIDLGWKPYQITLFLGLFSFVLGIGAVETQTGGKFLLIIFLLSVSILLVFALQKSKRLREK